MARKVRLGYMAAEKTEMWDRWQRGESLKSIGRAFGYRRSGPGHCQSDSWYAQSPRSPMIRKSRR